MRRAVATGLGIALLAFSGAALSQPPVKLCQRWSAADKIGRLDLPLLREASGIAVSGLTPNRLYHHNDAAGGAKFYVTDKIGGATRTVALSGYEQSDFEDMTAGRCTPGEIRNCLFFGDMGDNARTRTQIAIVVVAEQQTWPETVVPLRVIRAKYPNGAQDAEGLALHPNGDLYLLTKAAAGETTRLYRLTAAQAVAEGVQTLTEVGTLDLPNLMAVDGRPPPRVPVATSMDITPDGKRVLILTYRGALELLVDLSKGLGSQAAWVNGRDYRSIATASLPQAEAVSYLDDGAGFVYDSEYMRGGPESPLFQQRCMD